MERIIGNPMIRTAQSIIVGLAVSGSVAVFLAVDADSHSVSDTLYGSVVAIAVIWLLAAGLMLMLRRTRRA